MINVDERKVIFGQGDIVVQARENLELYIFRLGGNYKVGETVKDDENDYEFITAVQSSANGWYEAYEILGAIKEPDNEIRMNIEGIEATIVFAGDKWMDSIRIVQRSIARLLLFEANRLEENRIEEQVSKIKSGLTYKNSKGETTWLNRSRNVAGITESDIEVISKSLKDDADNTRLSLKESKENIDKASQENMKTYEAAMDEMRRDIKYTEDLLSKISNPKNIDEDGWRHIFITLVKDDDEQAASFLRMENKSDEYYNSLRDTTYRVELISGIAGTYNEVK